MTTEIESIRRLLVDTSEAHDRYEKTELDGVYDEDWSRWYAEYATDHGLGNLVGHPIDADVVAVFLASSNADFQRLDPRPDIDWATYTAGRIAGEL